MSDHNSCVSASTCSTSTSAPSSVTFSPSMFSVLRAGAMVNLSIWSSSWLTRMHLKLDKKITRFRFLPNLHPNCFQQASRFVRL